MDICGFCTCGRREVNQEWNGGAFQVTSILMAAEYPVPFYPYAHVCSGPLRPIPGNYHIGCPARSYWRLVVRICAHSPLAPACSRLFLGIPASVPAVLLVAGIWYQVCTYFSPAPVDSGLLLGTHVLAPTDPTGSQN